MATTIQGQTPLPFVIIDTQCLQEQRKGNDPDAD